MNFQASSELDDLRAELATLSGAVNQLLQLWTCRAPALAPHVTPATLRSIIQARRAREKMFGARLFADPAWDMLLEAYRAELTQGRLSVSQLCQGSPGPAATVRRWIGVLEEAGWLETRADPQDDGESMVALSARGASSMSQYFSAISPAILPL